LLLQDILTERATRTPDRIAIVAGRRKLTYAALAAMVDGLAAEFQERALPRGERLAIFSDNWSESVVSVLGALRAGVIACPIHPLTTADRLNGLLRHWRVRAMVTEARLAGTAAAAIRTAESVRLVILAGTPGRDAAAAAGCIRFEDAVISRPSPPRPAGSDGEIAFVLAESGPNAPGDSILVRHREVVEAIDGGSGTVRDGDAVITSLRLTTRAGIVQLFAALHHGTTLMHSMSGAAEMRPMMAAEAPRPLRSMR
jgi:acyl-CoA synthetase (AMP-forming)/AMP-acid ligase II